MKTSFSDAPYVLVLNSAAEIQIAINLSFNTNTDQNQFQEEYDWLKTLILQQELFDGKPLIILENKQRETEISKC
mgnify:FL=1